jgi:AcrR family transcriptional regulator
VRVTISTSPSRAGTKGVPRGDREAQIVEVACLELGAAGYAATSVEVIAAGAGISKPLVYQYFGSKEGLHLACVEHVGTLLQGEIERIARGGAVGLQRGMLTLAGMFDVLDGRAHLWRVLFDPTAPPGGASAEVVARHTARIEELTTEGVTELLALHGPPEPGDVSALVSVWLGIVDSFMNWWLDHPDESAADMAARGFRLAEAAVRNAAG